MTKLDWMHPSYRDLVIDELASDKTLRDNYLRTANISDFGLAFSTQGGDTGTRTMPLIVDDDGKRIIEQRIQVLFSEMEQFEQSTLLSIIGNSVSENDSQKEWTISLLDKSLTTIKNKWQGKSIAVSLLEIVCRFSLYIKPLPQLPDFEPTWDYQINLIRKAIKEDFYFTGSEIGDWAKLISLLIQNEPRLLTQLNFPDAYSTLFSDMVECLESDVHSYILSPTEDEIRNEIDRLNEIIDGLKSLYSVENSFQRIFSSTNYHLQQKRDELADSVPIDQEPEFEEIDDRLVDHADFVIEQLFSDL